MDRKKTENEFQRTANVVIKDGPEFASIQMAGREFRIWAESSGFDGDFDPAAVYEPGYEWSVKDFTPKEIILDRSSLTATDQHPIDTQTASAVLDHLIEYYKAQGMTVQVR
jgi:hypothetical protein